MPNLLWQTSDLPRCHDGIQRWLDEAALANVLPPLALDVNETSWPIAAAQAVFTANTLHIVSWPSVCSMFSGVSRVLEVDGLFCIYGPFSYAQRHTSASNAHFDAALRARDPRSGVRDFNDVGGLARSHDLRLEHDHDMPANNRLLVFRKAIG